MKIELLYNNIIKARLTRADLEQLNISIEEFACGETQTRRIIEILLDAARCELNADIAASEHMLIEVMPNRKGGCCVYVCVQSREETAGKHCAVKNMKPCFFDFDTADSLMSAVCALRPLLNSGSQLSELYRTEHGGYRLLVYPDGEISSGMSVVLSQYCRKQGSGSAAAAFTREHCKLIVGGDAIGKMTGSCGA